MKERILSIDFDYFIGTDLDTRNNNFPDGYDDVPEAIMNGLWDKFYAQYPELNNIGIINDYFECLRKLETLEKGKVLIANSHKEIARLFPLIGDDLEVIHIDFHHDNYISGGNNVDCANWVRHLKDLKPNAKIRWIRRFDSETTSLCGEYPYDSSLLFDFKGEFDYIFLCFSPEWTPPHLRPMFEKLCESVSHLETL